VNRAGAITTALITLSIVALIITRYHTGITAKVADVAKPDPTVEESRLPELDAGNVTGVREISRSELIKIMTSNRPLSKGESVNLDRGCPGLVCVYQGLGLRRWPESARDTRAYLRLRDALRRQCPKGQENFIFLKQAWWEGDKPPEPNPTTGEVSLLSITRQKPGWYSFNYAVYFPATATYVWINHREYGFPLNLIRPQKAYLSHSPPPVEEYRPAEVYCSTCR
jgi:hypothetical protein